MRGLSERTLHSRTFCIMFYCGSPIGKAIIAGKCPPGVTIRVTAKNGELVI